MMALHGRVEQIPAEEASVEDLLRIHTPEHVERVREAVGAARTAGGPVALDEDTRVSEASWDAALGSLGAAITAAGAVADGRYRNAFVATRPPGHHATPDRAMGFCLFNHVAATARWLQSQGHARRVLIVDWDVHHGNGTQAVFWTDPSVFFLSLQLYPHWPGSGAADEARRILAELGEDPRTAAFDIALVNLGLGQLDAAVDWLEKAYDSRDSQVIYINMDPRFDPLRGEPRFDRLIRQFDYPPAEP